MKKYLILLCCFALFLSSYAQFSSPSDVTYNAVNKTFYVASQGTGEIIAYKNNNKTTLISGLTKPNAVIYGTLPLGSGFLVADSNVVKAYTAAGALLTTINFPGAIELSDIVGDYKTSAMYVSDVGRGYIYKVTFGSAPFYLPSVSNFQTSGLTSPSSMYFDSLKRSIMIVSMVNDTKIQSLNVDTKVLKTAFTSTIDMAYGLEKDLQGNFYITSWSDNYVYQVDKHMTKQKKMVFYNKPAKLYFEPVSDYLYFTCFGCGKLEQVKIHNFAPDHAVEECGGDSFQVYTSSFVTNYGCYGSGNRFYIQVSDKNGSFSNVQNIATVVDTLIPWVLKGKVPSGLSPGNYKIRMVSTVPYIESTIIKDFIVQSGPEAFAFSQDTAFVCTGEMVQLGKNNPKYGAYYKWTPATGLDNDTFANPMSSTSTIQKYWMQATDSLNGCKTIDSVVVKPISNPPVQLKDTVVLCKGNAVKIGSEGNSSFVYQWTPGALVDDSTSNNPSTEVKNSTWFYVQVGSGSCSTMDSVFVQVENKPELIGWKDTFWKCREKTIFIGANDNVNYEYNWAPPSGIDKTTIANPTCFTQTDKVYELVVTDKRTMCKSDFRTQVKVYSSPAIPVVSKLNDTTLVSSEVGDSFVWYKNEEVIPNSNSKQWMTKESGDYQVRVFSAEGCYSQSGKYKYLYVNSIENELKALGFEFYPNPINEYMMISSSKKWKIAIQNMQGKTVYRENGIGNKKIQMDGIVSGVYTLKIELDNLVYALKLSKI